MIKKLWTVEKTGDNYAKFGQQKKRDDNSKVRTHLDEKHPEKCGK
jgi:hypothetical protein